ncbi:MAG: hypothetical protein HY602_03390 [Parcubacteria group bacterium]|nr:hypothetical protein [Parcubacteria group bacterium]
MAQGFCVECKGFKEVHLNESNGKLFCSVCYGKLYWRGICPVCHYMEVLRYWFKEKKICRKCYHELIYKKGTQQCGCCDKPRHFYHRTDEGKAQCSRCYKKHGPLDYYVSDEE